MNIEYTPPLHPYEGDFHSFDDFKSNFSTKDGIYTYAEWEKCIVDASRRRDNYAKQAKKLETIRELFNGRDPILSIAYLYFHKELSVHHICNTYLQSIYAEKALHVCLTKQLGWTLRPHNNITSTGKEVLGLVANIRERHKGVLV